MKSRWTMGQAAVLLSVAAFSANAKAQSAGSHAQLSSSAAAPDPLHRSSQAIREIDDPHLGARWLLMRDRNCPAGPGRLVLIPGSSRNAAQGEPGGNNSLAGAESIPLRPVIHAGDRLIVEENTASVEARLEAVALGPAVPGSVFDVRLKIGGKVARAIAMAPGRAAFAPRQEARP